MLQSEIDSVSEITSFSQAITNGPDYDHSGTITHCEWCIDQYMVWSVKFQLQLQALYAAKFNDKSIQFIPVWPYLSPTKQSKTIQSPRSAQGSNKGEGFWRNKDLIFEKFTQKFYTAGKHKKRHFKFAKRQKWMGILCSNDVFFSNSDEKTVLSQLMRKLSSPDQEITKKVTIKTRETQQKLQIFCTKIVPKNYPILSFEHFDTRMVLWKPSLNLCCLLKC